MKKTVLFLSIILVSLVCLNANAQNKKRRAPNNTATSTHSTKDYNSKACVVDGTNLIFTVKGVKFEMILVESGDFMMGARSNDIYANDNEKPAHNVTLTPYFIGKTEVTQELWEAIMGDNPSNNKSPRHPVEQVSYEDCKAFIEKLNLLTDVEFSLPTEAQWEYAARGGRDGGYRYAGTTQHLNEFAWYNDNSNGETHDVATKRPNGLGLFDMSGNVSEWCNDWWGDYPRIGLTNPTGPSSGPAHILRGGNFECFDFLLRVSHRRGGVPNAKSKAFGLRLAIEVTPSKLEAYKIYSSIARKKAPKNNKNKIETGGGLILY